MEHFGMYPMRRRGVRLACLEDWSILLVGGVSGTGKTNAAVQIAGQAGCSWLQVDDLRLALQRSNVTLPQGTDDLYFFLKTPNVWSLPPERLCQALIAVGKVIAPAIEVIIENHIATQLPILIEGDGILPSFFACESLQKHISDGRVRGVFLIESDEAKLLDNMLKRNRGIDHMTDAELRTEAHAKWLYGRWLIDETQRYGLPLIESRPWSTLAKRILKAVQKWNLQ
jgi:2-phosphoglycerate kinase